MEVVGNAAGLDLGKKTYEMCLIDPNGKVTRTGGKTGCCSFNVEHRSPIRSTGVSAPGRSLLYDGRL